MHLQSIRRNYPGQNVTRDAKAALTDLVDIPPAILFELDDDEARELVELATRQLMES